MSRMIDIKKGDHVQLKGYNQINGIVTFRDAEIAHVINENGETYRVTINSLEIVVKE